MGKKRLEWKEIKIEKEVEDKSKIELKVGKEDENVMN